MSRNGSGTYSLPAGNPVVTGTTISSVVQNNTMNDIAAALTASLAADGQTPVTGSQAMGTFKHTNVGASNNRTDYARTSQVQDSSFVYAGTAGGTGDALTLTLVPAITAYAAGQSFFFISSAANTTAATVAINGIASPKNIYYRGAALTAGMIKISRPYGIWYDGTQFNLVPVSDDYIQSQAIQSQTYTWGGTSGGAANVQTITITPSPSAYAAGQRFSFIAGFTNTGATTINVSSLGAKNITKDGAVALAAGDITAGDVVTITYDGTQFQTSGLQLSNAGRLLRTTYYITGATWTKSADVGSVLVKVYGAGGGGGGAGTNAGANGSGGGGGGYSEKTVLAGSLGATETVTIGAAGTAGIATGGNGGNGGTSSFGAHASSTGGIGGSGQTTAGAINGGVGGAGASGDLNLTGGSGGPATVDSTTAAVSSGAGAPGAGGMGQGGGGRSTAGAGFAGTNYGGGGSGALRNLGDVAGGAGGAGLIIVQEFS